MHAKGVFNPNIPIFASNSAMGLHFSAFHFCGVHMRAVFVTLRTIFVQRDMVANLDFDKLLYIIVYRLC